MSVKIWLVTFMDYDLGYFDDQTCRLEPLENPFGPKLLLMSPGMKRNPWGPFPNSGYPKNELERLITASKAGLSPSDTFNLIPGKKGKLLCCWVKIENSTFTSPNYSDA
jgi:hypothetical protein